MRVFLDEARQSLLRFCSRICYFVLHGTCQIPGPLGSLFDQGAVDSFVDLAANVIVRYEGPTEEMAMVYAEALGLKSKVDSVMSWADPTIRTYEGFQPQKYFINKY